MWRYTAWKGWIKGLLTFFFVLGAIPLLLIWTLIFGLKGYSFVDSIANPKIINQSKLYNCQPTNSEWGKCINSKYGFSFEYPSKWSYVDLKPEGIGFAPSSEDLKDSFVIAFASPRSEDSEEKAKEFAKFREGKDININGLYANEKESSINGSPFATYVMIASGKNLFDFNLLFDNANKSGLTNEEART